MTTLDLMEHRFKRKRVSKGDTGQKGGLNRDDLPAVANMGFLDQGPPHPKSVVNPPSLDATPTYDSSRPGPIPSRLEKLLAPPHITPAPEQIYKRQILPLIQTVITSVIDVVLDSGSSRIAEVTLDAGLGLPSVVSFPSYGPVTVAALTTPLPNILPSVSMDPLPVLPTPMSIDIPGASSQIVISSPPPTPLPSDLPPIASTDTFFASISTMNNSSTSIFTSTGSGTTLTGSSIFSTVTGSSTFSTGYFAGNSTRTGLPSNSSTTGIRTGLTSQSLTTDLSHSATLTLSDTSSVFPSSTAIGGGGVVAGPGNPAGTGATAPTASSTAGAGSGSETNPSVATPAVVGGVVGGVAGLTIILVFLLFILRWRRRKMLDRPTRNGDSEMAPPGTAQSTAAMAQSAAPFAETGLVPFFRKLRPHSGQTTATTETTSSERGFQNLGGRKIESVLISGGDGYGGAGRGSVGNVSSSSFYRDSQGTYGGPGSLPSSMFVGPGSPTLSPPMSPLASHPVSGEFGAFHDPRSSDKEVAVMRPGPNRVPVRSPGFSTTATPPPSKPAPQASPPPLVRPDGIGRSHPSMDGSRGSKFAENLP